MADWASFNEDLLALILKLLPPADYARFAAVCKPWRSLAAQRPYPPAPQLPWLWFKAPQVFYSLSEDKTYHLDLPEEVVHGWPSGSYQGWLIMTSYDRTGHFLFNPFARSRIQLPRLRLPRLQVPKIALSSPPNDPNCIAFALCPASPLNWFQVCKPMESNGKWTYINCDLSDAIFYGGSLYITTRTGELKLVELSSDPPNVYRIIPPPLVPMEACFRGNHLLEFHGDLLMLNADYADEPHGYKVFRANFGIWKWEALESLGDHMIFFTNRSSLSVKASDLPDFEPNCIYKNNKNVFGSLKRRIEVQFGGERPIFKHLHRFPPPGIWLSPTICL